jgi:hypothetical protein
MLAGGAIFFQVVTEAPPGLLLSELQVRFAVAVQQTAQPNFRRRRAADPPSQWV